MSILPTAVARAAALAAMSACLLAAGPARAGLIYLSQYGIDTDHVVTFASPERIAAGTAAGSLFAGQGVSFTGGARVNPCASAYYGYGAIRGNHLGTLSGACRTDAADEQFTLTLAQPVERFTMSLAASDPARKDYFSVLHQGAQVAAFSLSQLTYYLGGDCAAAFGCVAAAQVRPQGYLVIEGIVFDQLRFMETGADASWLVFDNLGFDTVRQVPEPPLPALAGAVLLALAAARALLRRRRPAAA